MNILHVTNFYKPSWYTGGVARYSYELSREQETQGHDVKVICTQGYDDDSAVGMNTIDSVDVIRLNTLSKTASRFGFPIPTGGFFAIKSAVRWADIIHIHEHRSVLSVVVASMAKFLSTPYLVQEHGSLPYDRGKGSLKRAFDITIGNKILNSSDSIIALSYNELEEYISNGIDRIRIDILPNAVSLPDHFMSDSHRKDNFLILYAGRITERKGIDLLVRAFSELQRGSLTIIGADKGFEDTLLKIIENSPRSNSIEYRGFVSEDEKKDLFRQADIFVQPTRFGEGVPTAALEAASFNLPVVATRASNLTFIEDHQAGIVVDSNPTSIADGIQQIIEKYSKYSPREMIKDEFTWEEISRRSIRIYEEKLQKEDG